MSHHQLPNHAFLAVVHVQDTAQAIRNAHRALENGAHGIFLINHSISAKHLIMIYDQVRNLYPHAWIGLNCLDLDPEQTLTIVPSTVSALWFDSLNLNPGSKDPVASARRYHEIQKALSHTWKGKIFGGVAFKYQPKHYAPAEEVELVSLFIDVITTSGEETGSAPSVEKIRLMKAAAPHKPLAIASGTTPENVHEFFPYANYFLVATGISNSHTELNPILVRNMADKVRAKH